MDKEPSLAGFSGKTRTMWSRWTAFIPFYSRFRAMPGGLCFNTLGAIFLGGMLLTGAFVPSIGHYSRDGIPVPVPSLREFWQVGIGPVMFGIGVWCGVFAYGVLAVRSWVRHFTVVTVWGLAMFGLFSDLHVYELVIQLSHNWDAALAAVSIFMIAVVCVFPLLITRYFYFHPQVKKYFANGLSSDDRSHAN